MLFARNKDVPGVIGKVGTMLGEANINIGAYLLSREMNNGEAFAVLRVDNSVPEDILLKLEDLPEILSVQQLHC
jgi:D-3-phosphoglycerate dehydrogenase